MSGNEFRSEQFRAAESVSAVDSNLVAHQDHLGRLKTPRAIKSERLGVRPNARTPGFIVLHFIVLHRCCIFRKVKARPAER